MIFFLEGQDWSGLQINWSTRSKPSVIMILCRGIKAYISPVKEFHPGVWYWLWYLLKLLNFLYSLSCWSSTMLLFVSALRIRPLDAMLNSIKDLSGALLILIGFEKNSGSTVRHISYCGLYMGMASVSDEFVECHLEWWLTREGPYMQLRRGYLHFPYSKVIPLRHALYRPSSSSLVCQFSSTIARFDFSSSLYNSILFITRHAETGIPAPTSHFVSFFLICIIAWMKTPNRVDFPKCPHRRPFSFSGLDFSLNSFVVVDKELERNEWMFFLGKWYNNILAKTKAIGESHT